MMVMWGLGNIINCYHNNIKDSLIAHLTLVGHNDIINDFKMLLIHGSYNMKMF